MLSKKTIDEVKQLAIESVIQKYVPDLKKAGSVLKAKSPFTEENSPSFVVSPSKGIYKCFSTGIGGSNGVGFLMELKKIAYIDAIKELASEFSITIEYDDSDRAKIYLQKEEKIQTIAQINAVASIFFVENLSSLDPEFKRSSDDINEKFNIGFAPDSWDSLYNYLVKKGFNNNQILDAGLITLKKSGGYFDTFRGRVMFPIYDDLGKILGFTGRIAIKTDDKETAKVLNSKESDAFSKEKLLLGFYQAKISIKKQNKVIVVEGNYDVTSMHEIGFTNTVASLGTAFTEYHAQKLSKIVKNICFFIDNDKAGKSKIEKNTFLALENKMQVSIFIPEKEKSDPDDWCKEILNQQLDEKTTHFEIAEQLFNQHELDAVEYLAAQYFSDVSTTIKTAEAHNKLVALLCKVADSSLRNQYVKTFFKLYKIDKALVEKSISIEIATKKEGEEQKDHSIPSFLSQDEAQDYKEYGFYPDRHKDKLGYYFQGQYGVERISNWLMRPLFHVLDSKDSKRFIELDTHKGKIVVEIPNVKMNNPQSFEDVVSNRGPFYLHASKKQYQRLKSKFLVEFPMCYEIKTLGWYYDGFFAFANGIVENGKFKKVDQYGLVNFDNNQYFLPAFSSIYKENKADDDVYETDRKFIYKAGNVGFEKWARQFYKVYQDRDNSMFSIAFLCASLFSDYIFSNNEYFPLLMMTGQPRTGKSTCGRSLTKVFKTDATPFNLHSGTVTGFQRVLSRMRNVIVHLDEYRNDMDEKRFQALKGIWDRTGSVKGEMSQDNRTKETKIYSSAVITGQHKATRDGNSLYTRVIELEFFKKQDEFTNEEIKDYELLKEMEHAGLSDVIVDIIKHRPAIEKYFTDKQFEIGSKLRDELAQHEIDGRVTGNFLVLLSVVDILKDVLKFPFSFDFLYQRSIDLIIEQSKMISESDELAEFFNQLVFLSLTHAINENEDYKLLKDMFEIKVGRGKDEKVIQLNPSTHVLYIKMAKIYPLYKESIRKQNKDGLDQQTILSYMKTHKAYLGQVKTIRFKDESTSAYAFDWLKLGNLPLKGLMIDESESQANMPTSQHNMHISPAIQKQMFPSENNDDMPF